MSRNGKLILNLFIVFVVCEIIALISFYSGFLKFSVFWSSAVVAAVTVLIGYPRVTEEEQSESRGNRNKRLAKIALISLLCFEIPAVLCLLIFNISFLIMPFAVAAFVTACLVAHWDYSSKAAQAK